jgi:hypothetical protein|tara:strand:- start:255 stop:581 length:327 start_codon:yes stop_codon:yes gene_type:complete
MAGEKIIGKITNVTDETGEVRRIANIPPETIKGVTYIRIDFSFKDEKMQERTGLIQLMFENDSYKDYIYKIPQKGSSITIIKKWFVKTYYKVDIAEMNKFINATKINK